MLERRERLKLEDGRELRLLSALEVLEARREAEGPGSYTHLTLPTVYGGDELGGAG